MKRIAAGPLLALLLSACAPARPSFGPSGGGEVVAIEHRRFEAMVQNDFATLDALLRDDLVYTHSSGQVDTKASLLESLRSERLRYLSIEAQNLAGRTYGETAVVHGRARMRVRSASGEQTFVVQFLDVYVRDGGGWRLAAWQSTRLPG